MALQRAGWRCERCGRAGRQDVPLEVHHRTYERVGDERPEDLEALCVDCHRGETIEQADGALRQVLKLARAHLNAGPFTSIADLSEAVKQACADYRLRPDPQVIQKAVGIVTAQRFQHPDVVDRAPRSRDEASCAAFPDADEARQILTRLVGWVPARQMPAVKGLPPHEVDPRRALGMVMQAIAETADRCADLEAEGDEE